MYKLLSIFRICSLFKSSTKTNLMNVAVLPLENEKKIKENLTKSHFYLPTFFQPLSSVGVFIEKWAL